ncbi:MAG: hypothetical protein AAF702_44080 [Chloroflexota bacterium]
MIKFILRLKTSNLQDGTLNLILRNRFEEEITQHQPDPRFGFRKQTAELIEENKRLKGQQSHLKS